MRLLIFFNNKNQRNHHSWLMYFVSNVTGLCRHDARFSGNEELKQIHLTHRQTQFKMGKTQKATVTTLSPSLSTPMWSLKDVRCFWTYIAGRSFQFRLDLRGEIEHGIRIPWGYLAPWLLWRLWRMDTRTVSVSHIFEGVNCDDGGAGTRQKLIQ